MRTINKQSIANDIFESSIKLNLETKRGADIALTMKQLREQLEQLENFEAKKNLTVAATVADSQKTRN